MSFDPTKLITTPDQAVTAANTMMQMSAVGTGFGCGSVSDAGIWESNTEGPLAAMLYAASPAATTARASSGCCWRWTTCEWEEDQLTIEPGWQMAAEIVQRQAAVLQRADAHAGHGSQAARQHRVDDA